MPMPNNVILVRHGESIGNLFSRFSKLGLDQLFPPEFLEQHSSNWRLSDTGIEQSKAAGEYIRNRMPHFDRYIVSEYTRAEETAANLNLPDALWYPEINLREREWGDLSALTYKEKQERFSASLHERKKDPFFWIPPNGESLAQVCVRVDRVIQTLHRECEGKNVLVVCHGEIMWAFRVLLERMTQERFGELEMSDNPHDNIHNCQILHYTRVDPISKEIHPYLDWMTSVCPWDLALSSNEPQEIKREGFTNEKLRQLVERDSRFDELLEKIRELQEVPDSKVTEIMDPYRLQGKLK